MQKKNLLFDLDGTLVNTKRGIFNSIKYVIEQFNLKNLSENELSNFIGPPLVHPFMKYFSLSEDEAKECVKKYREYYSKKGVFECELYPHIEDLIKSLYKYDLYVSTSKPTKFANIVLKELNVFDYFKSVVGSEPDLSINEKEQVIEITINKFNLVKKETLMIGDTVFDAKGAYLNNIDFVGVLYGFGNKDEMKEFNPIKIVSSVEDLKSYLT